jgi:hypothetical protein
VSCSEDSDVFRVRVGHMICVRDGTVVFSSQPGMIPLAALPAGIAMLAVIPSLAQRLQTGFTLLTTTLAAEQVIIRIFCFV